MGKRKIVLLFPLTIGRFSLYLVDSFGFGCFVGWILFLSYFPSEEALHELSINSSKQLSLLL